MDGMRRWGIPLRRVEGAAGGVEPQRARRRRARLLTLFAVIGLFLLAACASPSPAPASPVAQPTVPPVPDPAALATLAVEALRDRDMARLAALAHPSRGVRFSPYAFVSQADVVLMPAQLETARSDPTVYLWGAYDGTGDPISLTLRGRGLVSGGHHS